MKTWKPSLKITVSDILMLLEESVVRPSLFASARNNKKILALYTGEKGNRGQRPLKKDNEEASARRYRHIKISKRCGWSRMPCLNDRRDVFPPEFLFSKDRIKGFLEISNILYNTYIFLFSIIKHVISYVISMWGTTDLIGTYPVYANTRARWIVHWKEKSV